MKKKSSAKRRHVVAWINKAEWDQVLEYLYSKDCGLQKYALQRVSAWKSRYANSTPVAVENTADLVRCQVLDRSGQLDGDDLILLYGTALVRFENTGEITLVTVNVLYYYRKPQLSRVYIVAE
uniref:Uncharacterized protein n=1 Tax=Myripristis murdjan TaxID=586833 RepID=A0A667XEN7_9TELE